MTDDQLRSLAFDAATYLPVANPVASQVPIGKLCEFAVPFARAVLKAGATSDALDAARYRWLREHAYIELECDSPRLPGWTNEAFDAAVDARAAAALAPQGVPE